MEYQFPLTAIHRNGTTRVLEDAKSFLEFARDSTNGNVGAYWLETYQGWGSERLVRLYAKDTLRWRTGVENDWIVRDTRGRPVDKEKVTLPPGQKLKPVVYNYAGNWGIRRAQRDKAIARAMELGLPIPGIRKRRWHRKSSTINGRNGAHNQRKGIKLYEDPKIKRGDFDDL
jgi:hypothetical protein